MDGIGLAMMVLACFHPYQYDGGNITAFVLPGTVEHRYGWNSAEWVMSNYVMPTNDPVQRAMIAPLVAAIRNTSDNKTIQARNAAYIVQSIPFDYESYNNKTDPLAGVGFNAKNRYPSEVLSQNTGVGLEKSRLLAGLFDELGFGSAIIDIQNGTYMHSAAGIKCAVLKSFQSSGYCFVETTSVHPIGWSDVRKRATVIPIGEGEQYGG